MRVRGFIKCFILDNFHYLIALSLLLLTVSMMVAAWGYYNPVTEEYTNEQTIYDYELEIDSQVNATSTTSLYDVGEEHTNLNQYQTQAFPYINRTYRLDEIEGDLTDPQVKVEYVLAVYHENEKIWNRTVDELTVNEGSSSQISLDIRTVSNKRVRILEENDRSTNVKLHEKVQFIETSEVKESSEYEISLSNSFYSFSSPNTIEFTESKLIVTNVEEDSPDYLYPTYILIIASILSLVFIVIVRLMGSTPKERWNYEMSKNSDRIVEGEFDINEHKSLSTIRVNSLSYMNRISETIGKPIVYDKSLGMVMVIDDTEMYYITKPYEDYDDSPNSYK